MTDPRDKLIKDLAEALKQAVSSGSYVVRLVEDVGRCGGSPNPGVKSDWLGTAMHCYAAMSFLGTANEILSRPEIQEALKK